MPFPFFFVKQRLNYLTFCVEVTLTLLGTKNLKNAKNEYYDVIEPSDEVITSESLFFKKFDDN